jgi:hypothetical protein
LHSWRIRWQYLFCGQSPLDAGGATLQYEVPWAQMRLLGAGTGAGWMKEEFELLNVPFEDRGRTEGFPRYWHARSSGIIRH